MQKIGFIKDSENKNTDSEEISEKETLLDFDSGNRITFDDAIHHILVTGTTGSGKTSSVVLPCVEKLIKEGHTGLIIDIKGNMRAKVREFARIHGREQDIVELGSGSDARACNILLSREPWEIRNLFEDITIKSFRGASNNLDFHIKGTHTAADCAQILAWLHPLDPIFEPTMTLVEEMVNDPLSSVEIFRLFHKKVFQHSNVEHIRFLNRVENNRFHVLKDRKKGAGDHTAEEQITYNLQGVRQALKSFLDAPGVRDNFSAPGCEPLDIEPLIKDGKIILLRFGPETGPIGASLSRSIINMFYEAVFNIGLTMPDDKKSFIVIDEFQEVAELTGERFSDVNFIALAREFKSIFIASTQSMSALINKGQTPGAVEAFTANCNQRICFYSDDPLTQEMAARYDPYMRLNDLKSGEAFVIQYNKSKRQHDYGIETFNNAFKRTGAMLLNTTDSCINTPAARPAPPSLSELVKFARRELEGTGAPIPGNFPQKENRTEDKPRRGPVIQDVKITVEKERRKPSMEISSQDNKELSDIIKKFPQLFAEDSHVSIVIPKGWQPYAIQALTAFSQTGLSLNIIHLGPGNGPLRAIEENGMGSRKREVVEWLNKLLEPTGHMCIICGKTIPVFPVEDNEETEEEAMPVCESCLSSYGLDKRE